MLIYLKYVLISHDIYKKGAFFIEQWNQKKLGGEREFRKEILK